MKWNIYVDANIFIAAAVYPAEDRKFLASKQFLYRISAGEIKAMTSFLTWDELFWAVKRLAGTDIAKKEGKKFLELPNLKFCVVDEHIINKSQEIAEKYSLHPRDAIHVASAITYGAENIISDDPDFDAVSEIKRISIEDFR